MDIEKHMNNRPLTYVESESGEDQVLTPNLVMWGQGAHILEDIEVKDDELTKFHRRLNNAKQNTWSQWQREYLHSLMDSHRVKRIDAHVPEVGEMVLILGEEKKPRMLEEREGDPSRERSGWHGERGDLATQEEAIGETDTICVPLGDQKRRP